MIWTVFSAIVTALLSLWLGNKRLFYLHQVSVRKFLLFTLILVVLYSSLLFLFKIEILTEEVAAIIITNVYASIFGFFSGAASNQYRTRSSSGKILYSYRSFISDHLPVIVAIALITLGIHRSAVLSELAITPIRITSGLSLASIGLWGMTLRLVPEFRINGIVLIDQVIQWKALLSYNWYSEEILEIEYEHGEVIRLFKTLVPLEDRADVEEILSRKLKEKMEQEDGTSLS